MSFKPGLDCYLARNTGNWNTPTWVEIEVVEELTPGDFWETADIRTRASPVVFGVKTMIALGFTVRVLCDDAATNYGALIDAMQSKTATIDLVVLDGPNTTNGSFGERGLFQVAGGAQPQPVDAPLYREFRMVPYPDTTNKPQWAEVINGTLNFQTIT